MPGITLVLGGDPPDARTLAELPAGPNGFQSFETPLHRGVDQLGFLSRHEEWSANASGQHQLRGLRYTVRDASENLFLAFYRLVPREPGSTAYSEHKARYLDALAQRWNERGRWSEAAEHVAARQEALLAALRTDGWAIDARTLATDARLIAGLGYRGALEVGITLHPLYGFPYLPGTAVKGIARTYAERGAGAGAPLLRKVFGSEATREDEAESGRAGCVRFFDALPPAFPRLSVDVMTPHFGPYYMDADVPGDWHSPVPVAFLTVAAGQPFRFALAARGDAEVSDADAAACLALAAGWLDAGLRELGAGAKTAAGYGYFSGPTAAARAGPPEP